MFRSLILAAVLIGCAVAQPVDPSITSSASRTVNLPAEEAVFDLQIGSAPNLTLAQTIAALNTLGVREEHLVSMSTSGSVFTSPGSFSGQRGDIAYAFSVAVPAAQLNDMLAKLEALRGSLPEGITRVGYNSLLSASAQAIEQARQSVMAELFAEARRRAESLARVAGASIGPVLSLGENSVPVAGRFQDAAGTRLTFTLTARFLRQ